MSNYNSAYTGLQIDAALAKAITAQQPPSEGPFQNGDKTKLDSLKRLTWIGLVLGWSAEPTLLQTIAEGEVYEYTYGSDTLYRLVPSGSASDAFYTGFSSGTLSGLVAEKGVQI